MGKYYVTIGLEMHCECSKTNTKMFSGAKNAFTDMPNTNIRPLDMGFPGTLPVVNKEAVRMGLMLSMIFNCKQPEYLYFERKNYYYPDMPKNFQITQNPPEECAGMGGYLDIMRDDGSTFRVDINDFHLEEDSASMNHLTDISTIDYNRAGVPLFELVTKPCIHSAEDAVSFLECVRTIYQYCDISEADSKKGQVRCDVNVSISDDENTLGTKVETKNVNSFSAVYDCINYEIKRQTELKDMGRDDLIVQETRRWDEESGTTIHMRDKVDAEDYKYFVEPNIPKYKITKEWLDEIKKSIPSLAFERRKKYIEEYEISDYDAKIIVKEKKIADYYEETIKLGANPKTSSNWLTSVILGHLNKYNLSIDEIFVSPKMLVDLIKLIEDKTISTKQAKEVLTESLLSSKEPISIVEEKGMKQIGDADTIINVVKEVLDEQPSSIEQYKNGRTNIVDFLVGQVMKKTKGQANPAMTRSMMIEEIEKR